MNKIEILKKGVETIRKNHAEILELKNIIIKPKTSIQSFSSRFCQAEKRITQVI